MTPTIKLYHDTRYTSTSAPIKIAITQERKAAYISTPIKVDKSQWDRKAQSVVNHPRAKSLNDSLLRQRLDVTDALLSLGNVSKLTAVQIRDKIVAVLKGEDIDDNNTFYNWFVRYTDTKSVEGTRKIYLQTLVQLRRFVPDVTKLRFEDINVDWLTRFEGFLAKTASKNARNIHLRNIRTVFNYAIDNDATTLYPFRRFKIRPEETKKRSLTVEQLRDLINYPCEPFQQRHVDMFLLMFYLCGINAADLFHLTEIVDGRVEYRRAKTHKLYSIKVEPEAMEIINRYRGKGQLLNILDTTNDYKTFLSRTNKALKRLGEYERHGLGGTKDISPLFPNLSTYWARHTWATIAAELDIPTDTIAAALGHGGNTVTDIYIKRNVNKVDQANRRVIDYVLYDKK